MARVGFDEKYVSGELEKVGNALKIQTDSDVVKKYYCHLLLSWKYQVE